ncbi:MAG: hypothetical protein M1834_000684 [Cirrosporium novae-zelandiae]|nr:MAG: hypothetical protein M1834_000684 [Cirrosporium novae-zelandiae]
MFVKFLATKDNNALHVKNVIRIHVSTVNVRSFVLIEIMDQYSKFVTRKLARYYGVIMDIFRDQHLSFDPDCAQIRASPMAADANKRLISARGDKFEIIGKKIINLRDRLITPFERSLYVLVKDELRLDSRSFRVPVYGYKLRCELLFSLCRYMTHVDALNMMTHLETLEDPSFNINLLAAGIPRVIYEQIAVNFSKIEGFIQRAQKQYLPTLEVELRLLQLGLKQVADKVGRDTRVDLFDTFERIENLSSEHKVAIGSHLGTAVTFKNILWAGGRNLMTPEKLMDSFAIEMRHFEGYKLGSFDVCLRGHPMSRTAWKNCLECGSGAKRPLVKEEQNGEKHIYNDKFLEVIRSMRASHVSSQISSEE